MSHQPCGKSVEKENELTVTVTVLVLGTVTVTTGTDVDTVCPVLTVVRAVAVTVDVGEVHGVTGNFFVQKLWAGAYLDSDWITL